ncbi:MAG: thrombospondin type 3 repeat-containing protein [Bacteroidetes bacterium]|nr:thrombospondin type 3 repeat-containing protein [Bacteroidota bacterium]
MHRKFKSISLFIVLCLGTYLNAQPPVYMGTGMKLEKKKGKWMFTYAYQHSLAGDFLPAPGKKGLQLVEVTNQQNFQSVFPNEKTTLDDILAVMVGPEGSTLVISLRVKGKSKPFYLTRKMKHFEGSAPYDLIMSTDNELEYIYKNFPYNYAKYTRPLNKDKDSLRDEDDHCPDEFGSIRNNGCPDDFDLDGVSSEQDSCPYEFGPAKSNGCPSDIDDDGILNETDACPFKPGPADKEGCPEYEISKDNDNDGIPEELDPCPNTWGSLYYNSGCPGLLNTLADGSKFPSDFIQLSQSILGNSNTQCGKYIMSENNYKIYQLNHGFQDMSSEMQYYLKDTVNDNTKYFFILYKNVDYKKSIEYFASMASDLAKLDASFETDTTEWAYSFEHQTLLYEPDFPKEDFQASMYEIIASLDDSDDDEITTSITLDIYPLRNENGVLEFNVRMWLER